MLLTVTINNSLSSRIFPNEWKDALITPLLKRLGLDLAFENVRPISNLQYVSKLTEKAVSDQMHSHMVTNKLFPVFQAAYQKLLKTQHHQRMKHNTIHKYACLTNFLLGLDFHPSNTISARFFDYILSEISKYRDSATKSKRMIS